MDQVDLVDLRGPSVPEDLMVRVVQQILSLLVVQVAPVVHWVQEDRSDLESPYFRGHQVDPLVPENPKDLEAPRVLENQRPRESLFDQENQLLLAVLSLRSLQLHPLLHYPRREADRYSCNRVADSVSFVEKRSPEPKVASPPRGS